MKTVTVTFPIKEAVEAMRLLRGESQCLIEQNEHLSDFDLNKRANLVLSARERICTSLEGIADLEDTVADPSQMQINIEGAKENPHQAFMDIQTKNAVNKLSGEKSNYEPPPVQRPAWLRAEDFKHSLDDDFEWVDEGEFEDHAPANNSVSCDWKDRFRRN